MEFRSVNRGYEKLDKNINKTHIRAWENGETGYPLVDASMKCLIETGYLNFRMRAMLVSFFTHHLWQPWKAGVVFLANNFLDFEPGIHYSQFQMQSGTTGINSIRIYNPIKQSLDQDPNGDFIKKWVPELKNIQGKLIHEPWKLTYIDQKSINFELGKDYPLPIVNNQQRTRIARDEIWKVKKSNQAKELSKLIVQKHASLSSRR
jgi:deoxyribodipyrimidine photo-lyase